MKYNATKNYKVDIYPNVQEELEIRKMKSRNCFRTHTGNNKYVVDFHDIQNKIDLAVKNCSCRM